MSRPTNIREALASAHQADVVKAQAAGPAGDRDPIRAAQNDRMLAERDRSPGWFATLSLVEQSKINTWAVWRATHNPKGSQS